MATHLLTFLFLIYSYIHINTLNQHTLHQLYILLSKTSKENETSHNPNYDFKYSTINHNTENNIGVLNKQIGAHV